MKKPGQADEDAQPMGTDGATETSTSAGIDIFTSLFTLTFMHIRHPHLHAI